jgi:hypothetical protein
MGQDQIQFGRHSGVLRLWFIGMLGSEQVMCKPVRTKATASQSLMAQGPCGKWFQEVIWKLIPGEVALLDIGGRSAPSRAWRARMLSDSALAREANGEVAWTGVNRRRESQNDVLQ